MAGSSNPTRDPLPFQDTISFDDKDIYRQVTIHRLALWVKVTWPCHGVLPKSLAPHLDGDLVGFLEQGRD